MTRIRLAGGWPLAPVLHAVAHRRGVRVERDDASSGWLSGVAAGMPLPDLDSIASGVVTRMLRHVVAGFAGSPAGVTGVVLVPAGGVCGAAAAGPVNAVRFDAELRLTEPVSASLLRLRAQQTRLWTVVADCRLPAVTAWHPPAGTVLLPATTDTARAAEYLDDAGHPALTWPGTLVLGSPTPTVDGVRVVAASTEAGYVAELVDGLVTAAEGRAS